MPWVRVFGVITVVRALLILCALLAWRPSGSASWRRQCLSAALHRKVWNRSFEARSTPMSWAQNMNNHLSRATAN